MNAKEWLSEIKTAKKREKDFREDGKKIRKIYDGKSPFNILFSNTEVIAPSLYSMVPRPVVQRRYKDKDPLGLAAAQAAQRMLEFMLDTNIDGYDTFHDSMKAATLDGLLPGRGVTAVKYEADVNTVDEIDVLGSELICTDIKSWDRVVFGYSKKWSDTPWIAFEEYIDEKEAERLFGKEIAGKIKYTQGEDEEKKNRDKLTGERKTACIYQIWNKEDKTLLYVSEHYPDEFLKQSDDPYGLTGFFNIPRPLQFVEKTDDTCPTAPYNLYESQASELNSLTNRIKKITAAIKARGAYDATLGDELGNIMEADDNELVPTDKSASLAAEKGLSNAIWFMPLDTLIQTLRELYSAREQCKQVIYEIMGISDIIRGASKASETLGAQQLKSQWGSVRIKNKQAEVQRYARDLLRIHLEIAAQKYNEDTWAKMTGLPFLTQPQVQQLQQQLMAMQSNPQFQQQAAQIQQQLQGITWQQILGVLKNDLQRAYRIDIETNSTVEPEAVEDQKNITEMMNALSQFLNGVGPMVQEGIMPFEVAKTMLTAITRRFRFGSEIEGQIEQMQPPKPKDDGKAAKDAADKANLQAQVGQLQAQLKAKDEQVRLIEQKSTLAEGERQLSTDRELLKLEKQQFEVQKQAAAESIQNREAVTNTKLDSRKQVATLEQKHASEKQKVAKDMDMKVTQGVKEVNDTVQQLGQMQNQLAQIVVDQAKKIEQIETLMRTPRKRRAVRDQNGRIIESIEEPVQ